MGRPHRLERVQRVPRPLDEVFAFFSDAYNLAAITPPFLAFRVLTPRPIPMAPGTRIDYVLRLFGVSFRWQTRIEVFEPGRRFVDVQLRGPYRRWHHRHEFVDLGEATLVVDVVDYELPLGPLGALAHPTFVRPTLERIFEYRRAAIGRLLAHRPVVRAAREPPRRSIH
jgi:ligand-binding SRPBCC domain-containing protein